MIMQYADRACEFCGYIFAVHRYNEVYCPECRPEAYAELRKDYYDRNRATILPVKRQYYYDHHEERLAYAREQYQNKKAIK